MKSIKKAILSISIIFSVLSVAGFQSAKAQFQQGFIGEVRMFAGNFAPRYWMFCDGSLLPIENNEALFSILGTTYGGDGESTFALPDLRGRMPIGPGTGPSLTERNLGEIGGEESHILNTNEMPMHTHALTLYADSSVGSSERPAGKFPARNAAGIPQYGSTFNTTTGGGAVGYAGSSQPHNTMPPYTGIYFIICVEGIFPSRP